MNELEALKARVFAAAGVTPSPSRAAAARQRWLVLSAAALTSLVIFALAGGVRPTGRPLELWMATSLGAMAIAGTAAVLAFRRGRSMLGRSAPFLIVLAVVTPLVLLAWKIGMSSIFPEMMHPWPDRAGFRCLTLAAATGIAPIAAMLYLWRATTPAHPRLTGLALGTAAGALVWALVDFWCPVGHVPHLLLGHALPLVGFGAIGAAAGGLLGARRLPGGANRSGRLPAARR